MRQLINHPGKRITLGLAILAVAGAALPVWSQTLEDALDNPAGVTFSTFSYDFVTDVELPGNFWVPQTVTTSDNKDALRVSGLSPGQFTRLDATFQGPARVSFQWKALTDGFLEKAGLFFEYGELGPLFGDKDWRNGEVRVGFGEQTVSWYLDADQSSQDANRSSAAYLDQVVVTPIPAKAELQSALDEYSFDFHSDDWTEQTDSSAHNGTWAQSGPVSEGEISSMMFAHEGPVQISFQWGLESDPAGFDTGFNFSADGVQTARITGDVDLHERNFEFGPGAHSFFFDFFRDFSIDDQYAGDHKAFVDDLEITPIPANATLADAVDTAPDVYGLNWRRQTQVTHDGVDAACVSDLEIGDTEKMYVELPDDAGLLSLWVKMSTEQDGGYLDLWVDGDYIVSAATGEQDWTKVEANLGPGRDRVLWIVHYRFSGGSGDVNDNAIYIDEIKFTPGGTNYQPDLWIKAPGGGSWKGKNRYNRSGVNQIAKYFASRRRPSGKFKFRCENDCPTNPDIMKFYGTRGNRHFDIFYIIRFQGKNYNVTSNFQTGKISTAELSYLQSSGYEVWIARAERGRRRSQIATVRGVSTTDSRKFDVVKAKLKLDRR